MYSLQLVPACVINNYNLTPPDADTCGECECAECCCTEAVELQAECMHVGGTPLRALRWLKTIAADSSADAVSVVRWHLEANLNSADKRVWATFDAGVDVRLVAVVERRHMMRKAA